MPLLTYDDVAPWSETIRQVVQERRMPPWNADPKHGKFVNDRRLADGERGDPAGLDRPGLRPGPA